MLTSSRRSIAAGIVTGMLAALVLLSPASAQFSKVHVSDNPVKGTRTNLFASWDGSHRMDGLIVALPAGWTLQEATILRDGYKALATSITPLDGRRVRVHFDEPVQGAAEVVLGLSVGDNFAPDRVEVVPLVDDGFDLRARHSLGAARTVSARDDIIDVGNQVLSLEADDAEPLVLRRDPTPDLKLRKAFRLALWMKSTRLGEVVLSTWNGDNRTPYPVELVVDQAGRLRAFRGRPGEHHSIASTAPVADGAWHRVELIHEPAEGWTWLRVDGERVDSLYTPVPPDLRMELPLVLGGRPPGEDPYFDGLRRFSGLLDDVEIRTDENAVSLDFQDRLSRELIEGDLERIYRVSSDRLIAADIQNFRADLASDGVVLTWRSSATKIEGYVVERSSDGHVFEEIERLRPNSDGTYRFHDRNAGTGVAYYRIRQQFEDGVERVSSMMKVGIGEEQPSSAAVIGNYPNPFNASTTIIYEVREMTELHLAIWDLSGQPIQTLVDRTQSAGTYQAHFDANDLPSGTYFVRLRTPDGIQSHKITLTK